MCGMYCLMNGSCCFGFPKPRNDNFTRTAHPLVSPLTERICDWQIFVTPPNDSPPDEGEGHGPATITCTATVTGSVWVGVGTSTAPPSPTTAVPLIYGQVRRQGRGSQPGGAEDSNPACVRRRRARSQRRHKDDATSDPAQSGYDVHHAQGHGCSRGNASAAAVKQRCTQSRVRQGEHAVHKRRSGCGGHAEACRQA